MNNIKTDGRTDIVTSKVDSHWALLILYYTQESIYYYLDIAPYTPKKSLAKISIPAIYSLYPFSLLLLDERTDQ